MFTDRFLKIFEPKKLFFKYTIFVSRGKKFNSFILGDSAILNCGHKNLPSRIVHNDKFFFSNSKCFDSYTVPNIIPALENQLAHEILKNSGIYLDSDITAKQNCKIINEDFLLKLEWRTLSKTEILENFETLSFFAQKNNLNLYSPNYTEILRVVLDHCSEYNDQEFISVLECLCLWKFNHNQIMSEEFRKILDDECLKRMPNWDMDKIFLINHHFYKLNIMRQSSFTIDTMKNLKLKKMTLVNFMQFAFMMKVCNRFDFINLSEFELCYQKYFDQLSINEISVVSMAFFKYIRPIHNNQLLLKTMTKLEQKISIVSDIGLTAILKIIRLSNKVDKVYLFQTQILLEALIPEVAKRPITTLTQIAHMKSAILLHNEKLMLEILKRFQENITSARLKDIERILFTLYTLNYKPENTPFYSIAMNELLDPRRAKEVQSYRNSFAYSILFMIQMNYCSEQALKIILDEEFMNKLSKNNIDNLQRDVLVIDYCIEIEHPDYKGPRLKKSLRNFLVKKFGILGQSNLPNNEKVNLQNKLLTDVVETCKKVFESHSVVCKDYLLPHTVRSDLVLCYDSSAKKFISPMKKLSQIPLGELKYAPNDGNKWFVLVVGSHNHIIRNTKHPTGILTFHMRHLRKIGYEPILISQDAWLNLKNDDKNVFIQNIFKGLIA